MKGYIVLIAVILTSLALVGSGYMMGTRGLAKEKAADKALLDRVKAENLDKDRDYEIQLASYKKQHAADAQAIADAAAKPVPVLLCHKPGGNPLPPHPAQAGTGAAPAGVAGNVHGPDIDYGPALRGFAVKAAGFLEACYAKYDQWPK